MPYEEPNINGVAEEVDGPALGEGFADAPESGAFPPDLQPGRHTFTFYLTEPTGEAGDRTPPPFEDVEIPKNSGNTTLQVNYEAAYVPPNATNGTERRIRFQRATFYQSEKMLAKHMNSAGYELLRALGLAGTPLKRQQVIDALTEASGRTTFDAEVGWELYDKATGITITTHPNKKDPNHLRWPRTSEGAYEQFVALPGGGVKVPGRLRIQRFKLPTAG